MPEAATKQIQEDLEYIKTELNLIKHILSEDFELSDEAKKSLEKARKTPRSQYVSHEEVKKRLLR
jgi:D-ribose pyranose/furanose isomerase RbsD